MGNHMNLSNLPATLGLLVLCASAGPAAAADVTGPYIAGNLGWSAAAIDDDSIAAHLGRSGLAMTSIDNDGNDIGVRLDGGYRLTRYFALEGGFFDLGDVGFTARTSPPGSLTGKMETQGVHLDPVLMLPLSQKLSALLRAGVTYHETETTYDATGSVTAVPDRQERTAGYKFGAGFQHDFSEPFSLRLEAEVYRVDDAVGNEGHMQMVSLGMVYRFWSEPAPVRAAERPPPPAAPRPALVLIVAPAPARTEMYCSILDIEFEINLVEIQREEKERLAVVATFLKKYPDSTAVIEGHTDDVGSDDDNLALSQRRAESVVSYLVSTYRIAPARLRAVGYGETRPLADNDTEEGKRQNRRIGAVIACAADIEGLTVIPARITMAMDMEFALNRAEVQPRYRDELAKVAKFLKANPLVTATVEGHTANLQGSPEQGHELSHQRATNVVRYLVDNLGVPPATCSGAS